MLFSIFFLLLIPSACNAVFKKADSSQVYQGNQPEMILFVFGLTVVVIMELTKRLSLGKAITLKLIPMSAVSTARSYLPCGAGLQDQLDILFAERFDVRRRLAVPHRSDDARQFGDRIRSRQESVFD